MNKQSSSNESSQRQDKAEAEPSPKVEGQADEGQAGAGQEAAGLSIWQMIGSTIAAAFGVQSSKNRERDFSQGKALPFIFMGIAFTILFVLAVVGVVNLVLP